MANIPVQLLNTTLNLVRGQDWQQRFSPKNMDGTAYDCTAISVATLSVITDQTPNGVSNGITVNVTNADTTGFTINASAAQLTAGLDSKLGGRGGFYKLTFGDGTNTGNVASGTFLQPYNGFS